MKSNQGYRLLAGKCRLICSAIATTDASSRWRLARGTYWCPMWNCKRDHWWLVSPDGVIYDPTRDQFPSRGSGEYDELDVNNIECGQCGKCGKETDMIQNGNYLFCSDACAMYFVGL
jgi:hypothetical protein